MHQYTFSRSSFELLSMAFDIILFFISKLFAYALFLLALYNVFCLIFEYFLYFPIYTCLNKIHIFFSFEAKIVFLIKKKLIAVNIIKSLDPAHRVHALQLIQLARNCLYVHPDGEAQLAPTALYSKPLFWEQHSSPPNHHRRRSITQHSR